MMKILFPLLTCLIITLTAPQSLAKPRVALLISGHGNAGDPALSYDLEELAQSYLVLLQNGVDADIVSPQGGSVPVHNKKDQLDYIQQFKQNTPALGQLANTLSAEQAQQRQYDALMIVGGDGAMFDLPVHPQTQALISGFIRQSKPVAAVCHGPAALVNLKTADGEYYVKGKMINSFTLQEEKAFSAELLSSFPFMLQTTLESRGATFVSNSPMLPYVAQDGNLITAQNPMSVPQAAEALLVKLGISPQPRTLFRDEATLQLVSRARSQGPVVIDIALARNPEQYDMNYLALYGFYAYNLAQSQQEKLTELQIMARIGKHFSHPQYAAGLVRAYLEQGFEAKARLALKELQQHHPEFTLPEDLKGI